MLVAIIQSDLWKMKNYVGRNHCDIPIANAKGKPYLRDNLMNRENK